LSIETITFLKVPTKKKYYHKKKTKISKNTGKNKIMAPMMNFGSTEWKENELIYIF
jgi:hypothetical protein